jgi:hypothetical protein
MAHSRHENRKLSLTDAFIKISDPAKLKSFEARAEASGYLTILDFGPPGTEDAPPSTRDAPEGEDFQHSRCLIALLSKPGGCDFFFRQQLNLGDRVKDAFSRYREIEDLFTSLTADFLAAAIAGHFTVTGFVGANFQTLDPQLFGVPGLCLHFDRNEIELPDGRLIFGIQITINQHPQDALADGVATDNPNQSRGLGGSSSDKDPSTNQLSDSGRRTHKGRRPKPIWKHAKTEAMRWFDDEGWPEAGDGGQARLEKHIADWLEDRGHRASESTVRRHVRQWIDEFRASWSLI